MLNRYDTDSPLCVLRTASANIILTSIHWILSHVFMLWSCDSVLVTTTACNTSKCHGGKLRSTSEKKCKYNSLQNSISAKANKLKTLHFNTTKRQFYKQFFMKVTHFYL